MKITVEFPAGFGPVDLAQLFVTSLEKLMSAYTNQLTQLSTDLAAVKQQVTLLKTSNEQLTADAAQKQIALDAAAARITDLQNQLTTAQASVIEPGDAALLAQFVQAFADLKSLLG